MELSESDSYSSKMKKILENCGGCAIINGGLGTELEARGADLKDSLWSAKCIATAPDLIKEISLDYLEAGANIITSASYQATIQGFQSNGYSTKESEDLLRRSVQIACEARDIFKSRHSNDRPIWVAASVGSYGAYLGDGSEYSGVYDKSVTVETLKEFHRRRVQVLVESGADLLAFNVIPNKMEAKAYAELLEEEDISIPAWLTFVSKDGVNVVSGDSLAECASIVNKCKKVVAVGITCTPPRFIHNLILIIRKVTGKPIMICPNTGETYDPVSKDWVTSPDVANDEDFVSYVRTWHEAGASLIGGCCKTTPKTISAIARVLHNYHHNYKM